MGLWDRLVGEFIDVIEWVDNSSNTLVYRFERYGNSIKNGAMLTVREGQKAVFVSEGEIADIFTPGMYELTTANLPILSTLKAWQYGFDSPFKAEVYFFNNTRFSDLKWGTKNPIMLRDADFGPTRLRAFGTYEIRIADPEIFLKEVVGTDGDFRTEEISNQLKNLIITRFSSAVAKSGIPVLDLAASYDSLSSYVLSVIAPQISEYGLELTNFLIENISLPKTVEEALDRRTSMGIIGDMTAYTKFQTAESMRLAAQNPNGAMGSFMGAGLGAGMAAGLGLNLSGGGRTVEATSPASTGHKASPLPPPLVSYHIAIDGKPEGPFESGDLNRLIQEGRLKKETLVWNSDLTKWTPAARVPDLAQLFTQSPPPLPPQLPPL